MSTANTNTNINTKSANGEEYAALNAHGLVMGNASVLATALKTKMAENEAKEKEDFERKKKRSALHSWAGFQRQRPNLVQLLLRIRLIGMFCRRLP